LYSFSFFPFFLLQKAHNFNTVYLPPHTSLSPQTRNYQRNPNMQQLLAKTKRRRLNIRMFFAALALIVLLILLYEIVYDTFVIHNVQEGLMASKSTSTRNRSNLDIDNKDSNKQQNHRQQQGSCLSLDLEENMDKLLSKYKQVMIVMPAKAAGSTIKTFTKKCMSQQNTSSYTVADNILNWQAGMNSAVTAQLKMPSMISSHITTEDNMCHIMKHATDDTLIVYSHRQETSRLISAIKQVITQDKSGGQVDERELVKLIKSKKGGYGEIETGNTQLLTCQQYNCIKDNSPNLVFMHFIKVSQMIKLLTKHHCPELILTQGEKRVNIGSGKKTFSVVLRGQNNNGTIVSIDDWLNAKSEILEISLGMKENVTCQATTRDIEYDLFACPDETLQISGRSYENAKIQFPL